MHSKWRTPLAQVLCNSWSDILSSKVKGLGVFPLLGVTLPARRQPLWVSFYIQRRFAYSRRRMSSPACCPNWCDRCLSPTFANLIHAYGTTILFSILGQVTSS